MIKDDDNDDDNDDDDCNNDDDDDDDDDDAGDDDDCILDDDDDDNRELKQQRRRRLRKRHLKSEVALLQTLSRLIHLVQFVKCWKFFLELNSKRLCIKVQEKKNKVVVLCSRPRQNVKLCIFTS